MKPSLTPILAVNFVGALGTFAITLPLLVLFVARALDGLTGGNISVADAYLADITGDAERSASSAIRNPRRASTGCSVRIRNPATRWEGTRRSPSGKRSAGPGSDSSS